MYGSMQGSMQASMQGMHASKHLKVVAMDTESNTASTATLDSRFCSFRGMPSFAKVLSSSGSTSSSDFFFSCGVCAFSDASGGVKQCVDGVITPACGSMHDD